MPCPRRGSAPCRTWLPSPGAAPGSLPKLCCALLAASASSRRPARTSPSRCHRRRRAGPACLGLSRAHAEPALPLARIHAAGPPPRQPGQPKLLAQPPQGLPEPPGPAPPARAPGSRRASAATAWDAGKPREPLAPRQGGALTRWAESWQVWGEVRLGSGGRESTRRDTQAMPAQVLW